MRRVVGVALSFALVVSVALWGVAQLLGLSTARAISAGPVPSDQLSTVHGIVSTELRPYFEDPAVKQAFAAAGLSLDIETAPSREIATNRNLLVYDFAFFSSAPAAEKVSRAAGGQLQLFSPFYSPMAIASYRPIVELLQAGGVAKQAVTGEYTFDMKAYLNLVAQGTRWRQLPQNAVYPTNKSVLVRTADLRTSNSAAMYLAIASYVANGSAIVDNAQQAASVGPRMDKLFLGQGYSESWTESPFDDYLALGMGKTPMLLVYESQFLERRIRHDPAVTDNMVLMYPTPDVLSKHTIAAATPRGAQVGQLLSSNPDLQRLAAGYGYRTADPAVFRKVLDAAQVPMPPDLPDIVDPPRYEVLEQLIARLEKEY